MKILKTILLFITILLGVAQLSFSQSTETAILTFTFPQQTTPAVIDDISHTIEIEVFYDTDATNLIPTFTLSSGADASIGATEQISGSTSNNFTNTLTYTITAEDGSTIQDWLVTVSNGYIAKYPFTGDATDATNNNYDGTVYGAILTTDRFENENGAYSFDGVDDYIDFGDEMLLDEDFTISFFVKFGNPDDVFQYVLSKHKRYENNSGGWAFGQSSGVLDFGYFGVPSNHAYSGPFQFSDQEWYQMAITFNDTDNSLTFYLNGINIGTQSADINILDTVWPIWMGAVFGDIPAYYKIIVDEFSIYNGALSESDIYAYYANYHAPDTLIASEEDLRVTLSWDYDSDINPVKYYIYRDTSSPSTTLYDSLLITPGSTSSFVDESITSDTTYYYRITSVDSLGNESMYSNEVSSTQHLQVSDYDGNVYNTLRVGNQIWTLNFMATTHYADGTPLVDGTTAGDITGDYTTRYYFAQDNDEANVATYGRLYTWAAAVNGGSGSDANPGDVQGVCPTGWHVPGDSEWKDLEMYLGMSQVDADNIDWRGTDEGGQIKSISSEWSTPNTGASNTSGFAAMPGGYRHTSGSFCCTGEWSNSWTATSDDEIRAWLRSLRNIYSQIGRWQYLRTDARSVRCIKDLAPLDLDLAADYQFNNNAYDASAGDHDALVYGATLTTDRFDSSNAAYSFDGTDDWIDTGFGTTETYTDLSVNLWFKSSATGGQIISRYNTYPDTEGLVGIFMPDINDTYFGQIKFEGELTEQLYTSTSYDYNIWHMATLVLNATTLKLDAYVDGAFVGSASYDGDLIATAHKWNIGTRYDGDDTNGAAFFGGSIDDVRIYSRVLTGLEVYSLYANYHAPDTLIAREDDSQVSLHWNYNTEISPVKYNIYRNTTQGNPLLYDSVLVFSSADSLFIDNAVTNYNQYYYTISSVDSLGNESPLSEEVLAIPCELITDYDGNTYRTIKIGKQIWMRENLSTTHYTDGTAMVDGTGAGGTVGDYTTKYQFSYNDDLNHAETYGRLYTWAAAMNGAASSNEVGSGVQGACPTGWYIPSDTAWKELEMYLGMNEATVNLTGWRGTDEGGKLKAPGTDYWLAPNTGATNETWFTALPGGSRSDGAFYDLLNLSYFWSATEPSDTTSLIRALRYINSGIHRQFYKKSNSMSIRCIKEHDPLEDSLLAYYPFNYSPDDASGNENHAVVNGASMTTDRLEYTNTAYAFDGVDDWIDCDFGASATYTDLTINTWFKAGTGGGQIVSRYDTYPGIDNMVSIRMNDNAGAYTGKLRFEGESGEYLYTNNTYEYGTWHMATLVLNSSTLKLDAYVDGLYVGSVNYDGTLGPSLYNWNIGARRDGDNTYGAEFFEGTLDEVRIYSRVLSDAEIIALYANYHAPDTLFVSSDDLKVILDWNYNSELNPVKYNVYKALNSSEFTYYGSVDIAKTIDTYFVDNDIIGDSTYHYKITSIDSLGNESLFSPEVAITPHLPIKDVDGNVYNTVRIGDQIWMQQNLAVTHYANGTPIADGTSAGDITSDYTSKYYFWYNNDSTTHAQNYGTLYTWAAAMDGAASYDSIPSGIQGVCPDGWHIPSDLEWKKLEMYIGMSQAEADGSLWRGIDEGGLLKAPDLWLPPNTGATNETGFNALPAGHRSQEGNFYDLNNFAYYWSTLENNASTAWNRALTYDKSTIYRTNYYKSNGLSVRCIRDEDRLDVGSMAYYPFNGDADDESKNGNVGTVHGATLTTDRYENENSAYSFDGIDDYISINTNSIFDFTSDATFSAFVKFDQAPFPAYTLFSKYQNNVNIEGWNISLNSSSQIRQEVYPSLHHVIGSSSVPIN
ncbi:MAG: FISUMP domain-containing protein, partial [Bacteroidota bacterium]